MLEVKIINQNNEGMGIGKIDNIEEIEPMVYPFSLYDVNFREDVVEDELEIDEILLNSGDNLYNQVKLPKVVE